MFDVACSENNRHQHLIPPGGPRPTGIHVVERIDDHRRIQTRHIARRFNLQPEMASLIASLCFTTTAVR